MMICSLVWLHFLFLRAGGSACLLSPQHLKHTLMVAHVVNEWMLPRSTTPAPSTSPRGATRVPSPVPPQGHMCACMRVRTHTHTHTHTLLTSPQLLSPHSLGNSPSPFSLWGLYLFFPLPGKLFPGTLSNSPITSSAPRFAHKQGLPWKLLLKASRAYTWPALSMYVSYRKRVASMMGGSGWLSGVHHSELWPAWGSSWPWEK